MLETMAPLLAFALVSTGTPGPNNVMVTASGANFGYRRSLPHVLGIVFGFPVMILCVGLGLGVIFERYPLLHQIMAALGVLYLLYLAWRIATAGDSGRGDARGQPLTFFEAALFQWINPKAWVMALGAISAFTQSGPDFAAQVQLVAAVFFLTAFPCVSMWTLFGVAIGRILGSGSRLHVFNVAMALLLTLSIVPVILRLIEGLGA